MAFPDGWQRRVAVTIDNTKVSGTSNLTDYPWFITEDNLPSEMFDADGTYPALNGGGDVRFTSDSAGTTLLNLEIRKFVTDNDPANGVAKLFVKVPTLDYNDDTVIYCWYNKSGETQPASDATGGSEGVWSDYLAVLPLDETSGSAADVTGNAHTGTFNGSLPTAGTCDDFDGQDFDGSGDYITLANSGDLDPANGMAQIITNPGMSASSTANFFMFGDRDATNSDYIQIFYNPAGANDGRVSGRLNDGTTSYDLNSSESYPVGSCYLTHITWGSGGLELFVNGVSEDSNATTNGWTNNATFNIGRIEIAPNDEWDGVLADFRMRSSDPGSDWIATEAENYGTPSTFSSAGTPETPGGDVTLVVDTMAMALTFNAVVLAAARKLIADTMAIVLTFADISIITGLKVVVDTMAIALTFGSTVLRVARKIATATMNIVLTFNPITFLWVRAYTLVVDTMSIALTFFAVILRIPGRWLNLDKNATTMTNSSKNSTSWTNQSK